MNSHHDDKPRLTESQKKKNHIESEKKRREAIRKGFEKLAEIVPECEGQARSEALVLQRTVIYLTQQLKKKDQLRERAMAKGMHPAQFEQVYRDAEAACKAARAAEAEAERQEEDMARFFNEGFGEGSGF